MGKNITDYTVEDIVQFIKGNIDALLLVDAKTDTYKTVVKRGMFADFIDEEGSYKSLIEKLWFHLNGTMDKVTEDYQVFIPTFGKFSGKYSKRLKIDDNGVLHAVQMTIYPVEENYYLIILDELDNSEYMKDFLTNEKVTTIQNTYLFSMYVDLIKSYCDENEIVRHSDLRVRTVAKKSLLKVKIIQAIDRQIALDDIATAQGLEFEELLDEVEAIVYSGTKLNIDYFLEEVMDEDHIDDIYDYFAESESDSLEDAINELGGECTEEEIRLVRIKFISDMAN